MLINLYELEMLYSTKTSELEGENFCEGLVVHVVHERPQVSKCRSDYTITMPGPVAVHAIKLFK